MKPHALVIDDDPEIRDLLKERLESFGHECTAVGSQAEAEEMFKLHTFAYVLLDLEIPIRYGRVPAKSMGENTLRNLRKDPRNGNAPVLVITAHGKDSPALAVKLMKLGAVDFLNKPFDDRLEESINEALQKHAAKRQDKDTTSDSMQPFRGGELTFTEEAAELLDVRIVRSNATGYRILKALAAKTPHGARVAMSGKALAKALSLERGDEAVSETIKSLRASFRKAMAKKNLRVEADSLIHNSDKGYSLSPGITWKDGMTIIPAPEEHRRPPLAERQAWFRDQVLSGKKMKRQDYEKQFDMSEASAKRDVARISGIRFSGGGVSGYYVPKGKAC
jgi:DNA-binding response OmpR family regulator